MKDSFEELSTDQVAIYDRQIRLWGEQNQKKLTEAEILILGLNPVNFELLKDIVLAGVNVVLWDNITTREHDLGCNFFLDRADIGKQRIACVSKIKEMNPMTNIKLVEQEFNNPQEICDNYLFKKKCGGIVISLDEEVDMDSAREISRKCILDKKFFFLSVSMGTRVFLFFNNNTLSFDKILDLNTEDLIEEFKKIKNLHPLIVISICIFRHKYFKKVGENIELFKIIDALKMNQKQDINEFKQICSSMLEYWGTTISPIASIGGGILCQEVTKSFIQGTSEYFCCLFDMDLCEAIVATIKK